ncbi:hypothetical protein NKR23_g1904 [Pleurostoma richardsiae]|uniref:Uncharacterized protein n=1 Tax=Pleurostoma richardsiae TaxID=41990 RepID=A0AA38RPE4_9PEZI|nr:hypothetical protein NKR23_g1904 [Pleurostoma richardsiae]
MKPTAILAYLLTLAAAALAVPSEAAPADLSRDDLKMIHQCFRNHLPGNFSPWCDKATNTVTLSNSPVQCCTMTRDLVAQKGWLKGFGEISFHDDCTKVIIKGFKDKKWNIIEKFVGCKAM